MFARSFEKGFTSGIDMLLCLVIRYLVVGTFLICDPDWAMSCVEVLPIFWHTWQLQWVQTQLGETLKAGMTSYI